ncbi:hypothetical protein [Longimicrobium sp.]|uniref:hypothetical protein n=1 Tax=Longimicrobium sp. TaxID=2029185 RepID=UPI002E309BD8|nr:hypothetical protein [Longimicrobium sp.]HEX6037859.1 hypothetical protein [Longimicrobium sp.]
MKAKLILAAALSLAACSTAPAVDTGPAPSAGTPASATSAALNPVGHYEFTTAAQGQMVTGMVDIAGSPGAYTGQVTTSATPALPISGVSVQGQSMVITGNSANGNIIIRMNFSNGTAFTGTWEYAGASGSLSGQRVN